MTVTYPIVKPARSMTLRSVWRRDDSKLPEPICFNGHVINPHDDIVVESVDFVTLPRQVGEVWTLIWVTLSGPDELLPPVAFDKSNPKLGPKDVMRPEGSDALDAIKAERLALRIAQLRAKEVGDVEREIAERTVNSEPHE